MVADYRDLIVFHKAHLMSKVTQKAARGIRSADYRYLKTQMMRSAPSVPANIVEESGQETSKEFIRFLRYSRNSANETEYHCFTAHDYGLMHEATHRGIAALIKEIRKMLEGLIDYLKKKPAD